MSGNNGTKTDNRLSSLDVLRGFDLWLLVFIGPVAAAYCGVAEGPVRDFVKSQTEHAVWSGFTLWDIIMPLFIFMSGITIPFSMARFREGVRPDRRIWTKLLRRFVLLFILGWIVQGNLLELRWELFHPLANTLQAIAISYTIAAVVFIFGGVRAQIAASVLCFAAYFLAFALSGQLEPDFQDNIAMLIDKAVLGSHRDGVIWNGDGSWSYDAGYTYTWILSSLNFTVTCITGCVTGHILRNSSASGTKRAATVLAIGAALCACGLLLGEVFPIVKRLWTSSMTLFSGGICCILIALSYYIVDVKGFRRCTEWLKFYGTNSIIAYCLGEAVNFSSVTESVFHGLRQYTGDWYTVVVSTANAVLLFLILKFLYRKRIFIKV